MVWNPYQKSKINSLSRVGRRINQSDYQKCGLICKIPPIKNLIRYKSITDPTNTLNLPVRKVTSGELYHYHIGDPDYISLFTI